MLSESLHTTVMGPDGVSRSRCRYRTWEMHHIAEYGIAAHWKYKQGISTAAPTSRNYEWVRRLLENQENTDAEDFIHTLKVDMFADEVFVFTPQRRRDEPPRRRDAHRLRLLRPLRRRQLHGRREGQRRASSRYDYELKNGDMVEILTIEIRRTAPAATGLQIAKSNEARGKIRQWFKKEKREENIVNGRAAFESELKHYGISVAAVTGDELRPTLLKKTGFGNLDDMYAAIGYGGFSAQKAVNRIRDELKALNKQQQAERDATVPIPGEPGKTRPAVPMREKSDGRHRGAGTFQLPRQVLQVLHARSGR